MQLIITDHAKRTSLPCDLRPTPVGIAAVGSPLLLRRAEKIPLPHLHRTRRPLHRRLPPAYRRARREGLPALLHRRGAVEQRHHPYHRYPEADGQHDGLYRHEQRAGGRPEERRYIDANVKKGELYFYFTTFSDSTHESRRSQEAEIRVE